ncbi:hypothetical protein P170DRAFT_457109 [Aspergillus steynii IBT 23096]|uniref:Beta-xylosidase C-terminal Concanavalin A-like domain-containing protein n=1 Tax=Aspergillus steynii IBT 23096 TaxID=1392250 RepID=A0A2I2G0W2_9EURO|nr:uncharacterized protein P170DRAFT_457109 [Aspergillus steynii IBT 23096]PLB46476.1 hypothetical protein P170DRAFT_457109 [Aspergillus steynii IBT 23096]
MSSNSARVQYHNPIAPGFNPDPSVVFVDGIFYLATSSFHLFPGLPIYASTDLRKWTHIGNAINRPEQVSLNKAKMVKMPLDTGEFMVGAGGLFAPTIRHHRGKFYIICTNAIATSDSFVLQNFVISTSDIWAGEWSDPVNIEFNGIDPSLFFDDDDRVYFQGCFMMDRCKQPSCTIKQFEVDLKTGEHLSEEKEIWGGHARYDTEGPHIYKLGSWYYLLVAEGGTFEHHMLCIGRSRSIWGPYEDHAQNPILTADGKDEYIQNIGHGELFQDGAGQWWAVGLGIRNENINSPGEKEALAPLGRETFLAAVEWPEDGWPQVEQPKMSFSAKPVRSSTGSIVDGEEFKASPSVGNLYIRTPDLTKYSIPADGKGVHSLFPSTKGLSEEEDTCAFVGRRQLSLTSTAEASLDISALLPNVRAGLANYKDNLRHISLIYDPSPARVSCQLVTLTRTEKLASELEIDAGEKEVRFRIVSSPTKWTFSAKGASQDEWTEIGTVFARDFVAREMTGPIFGLFAMTDDSAATNTPHSLHV